MTNFLSRFNSRLLRPVLISVLIISGLQVFTALWVTRDSVATLVTSVVSTLNEGGQNLATRLDATGKEVSGAIKRLSIGAGTALNLSLNQQLAAEQKTVRELLVDSAHQSAHAMAEMMALASPGAIWDKDSPALTRLIRDLHRNSQVVFAAYYDAEGKLLTRFVDRKDEQVKALLKQGKGKGSFNKLKDATKNNPEFYVFETDINPKGAVIGRFLLGVSDKAAIDAAEALDIRFEKLISATGLQVQSAISQEADKAAKALQQSLVDTAELNQSTGATTKTAIDRASSELISNLTIALVLLGAILVLSLVIVMAGRIVSKLVALTAELGELAAGEGDLTRRIDIKSNDEIGDMAAAINQFIDKTHGIVRQANSAADDTDVHIQAMNQAAEQTQSAVERQHQQVGQVSDAMAEMVDSIQQVAERIQENLANVDQIRQASNEASIISTSVKDSIETLADEVRQATEVVSGVASYSEQIEKVLDIIKGIAEQTNLLALNAAIEAARAGESGRGFAVVADEVRALASKTQLSTEDIQRQIDELQNQSREAVKVITNASGHAETGIEGIARSDQHLQSVTASVERLFDFTNDIAAMAEQQSQVSNGVNKSIEHISKDAELASHSVQDSTQESRALAATAESLKSTLAQFKI
ncbi:methyl-accepting chemotaxis protein [Motiliproteus sp. MSK22-1]|uniref:methyl-accepting chemotaxis protein n=1 Tax=Motiliproteus sp. MSK22-1 TaxID=1897630 RepID=UPI00097571E3|nr:methyl-accepting chemotaxis protein [Motiliproteus sp. MSK22-1]OMH30248.1 hypothetical protein BGP75_17805 [Motiliproteus sp. MSK22-1]